MFTIKLYRDNHSKIVEASKINIYEHKDTNCREIVTPEESFFIGKADETRPPGVARDLFSLAYIENQYGGTTETVRAP